MRAEVKSKLLPFEKFTVGVIGEKSEELAEKCEYRFPDKEGLPNCAYHSSAIGYCQPELCPRLKSKNQMGEDTRERKQ